MATFTLDTKQLEQLPSLYNTLQASKVDLTCLKDAVRQAHRVSRENLDKFSAWLFKSFCDSSGLSLSYDNVATDGPGIAFRVETSIPNMFVQGKTTMCISIIDAYKNVFWDPNLNSLHVQVYLAKDGQVTTGTVSIHYASGGYQSDADCLAVCQMKGVGFLFAEFVVKKLNAKDPELMGEISKVVASYCASDTAADAYVNKVAQLKNELQIVLANTFDAAAAEQVKSDLFSRKVKSATLMIPESKMTADEVSITLTPINLSVNERGRKVVRYQKKNGDIYSVISEEEMAGLDNMIKFAFLPDRLSDLFDNHSFESHDSIIITL